MTCRKPGGGQESPWLSKWWGQHWARSNGMAPLGDTDQIILRFSWADSPVLTSSALCKARWSKVHYFLSVPNKKANITKRNRWDIKRHLKEPEFGELAGGNLREDVCCAIQMIMSQSGHAASRLLTFADFVPSQMKQRTRSSAWRIFMQASSCERADVRARCLPIPPAEGKRKLCFLLCSPSPYVVKQPITREELDISRIPAPCFPPSVPQTLISTLMFI